MREGCNHSREELLKEVERLPWVHSIDLGGGLVTKGKWGPANRLIREGLDRIDFNGKKVLDIGCWDGLWSFEAEKRGAAEVYATDYISQRSFRDQNTFSLAHKILGSKVKYHPNISVYDIKELGVHDFDVVIFCGVYYHLKHPLLAFTRLREAMREGGTLLVEGPVFSRTDEVFSRFYYHNWLDTDRSNWWVPTITCLRQWIECSFFDIVSEAGPALADPGEKGAPGKGTSGWGIKSAIKNLLVTLGIRAVPKTPKTPVMPRHLVLARAACRKDLNYVFPDEALAPYDLNEYQALNELHGPNHVKFKVEP